ncbi:hypothetical protein HY970_04030 [Candidatus Kaiserbacteria bacterium]|nr:hypothetical protein [Candidatus Kaiserbacteria bacterium]
MSQTKKAELHELSYAETANIFWWSFRLSQGRPGMQERIFDYVARKHPELRFEDSEQMRRFPFPEVPKYEKFVDGDSHARVETVTRELLKRWGDFQYAMSPVEEEHLRGNTEWAIRDLTRDVIYRDWMYRNGRPGKPGQFSSQYINFVLQNSDAPMPSIIRELLADMREYAKRLPSTVAPHGIISRAAEEPLKTDLTMGHIREMLKELIERYNESHPGRPLDLSEFPALLGWLKAEFTGILEAVPNK